MGQAYELRPLTTERLSTVEASWRASMGDDLFDSEFRPVFAYAERAIAGLVASSSLDDSLYSELVETATGETAGLVDLLHVQQGRQMKVLNFHFGPQLWDYQGGHGNMTGTRDAMTATLLHLLGLASSGATMSGVKVYGRSDEHHAILTKVASYWPNVDNTWSASMHGRWLVFQPVSR
ncbi:hypothetical protein K7G68_08860 [Micrococcus luteus]|uniref:hypothetical protein n=1 Tax=Micrococcus luteus TaxID=1270 RepID=UPI001CA7870F|nr:hypothetical protein [Micrococcus luteus]QZY83662.1 hypothetical protein K7G68_08860 [Micrococcus luteus]